MQNFVAAFGMSPWGPMALAFLIGVGFGWAIWGARGERQEDEARLETVREPKEIVLIKAELQAARHLLEERDGEDAAISEQLSGLDETVKRANGRLKLMLSAIRRVGRGD